MPFFRPGTATFLTTARHWLVVVLLLLAAAAEKPRAPWAARLRDERKRKDLIYSVRNSRCAMVYETRHRHRVQEHNYSTHTKSVQQDLRRFLLESVLQVIMMLVLGVCCFIDL